jgi:hypothetical protein
MAPQILHQNIRNDLAIQENNDESGRGLYARRSISARELIISIKRPLVISLDTKRLKDTCYRCLNYMIEMADYHERADRIDEHRLQTCTGCHVVRYCSKVRTAFLADQI